MHSWKIRCTVLSAIRIFVASTLLIAGCIGRPNAQTKGMAELKNASSCGITFIFLVAAFCNTGKTDCVERRRELSRRVIAAKLCNSCCCSCIKNNNRTGKNRLTLLKVI